MNEVGSSASSRPRLARLHGYLFDLRRAIRHGDYTCPARMTDLPTGTVTFLFSDIEASTQLLRRLGADYSRMLDEHRAALRAAFSAHGGHEVGTEGDSFFAAFPGAIGAIRAAAAAQRALATMARGGATEVKVRIGIHTGEARLIAGDYVGLDVHRAARIAAAAHGGQVLVSEAVRALASGAADEFSFRDLGSHALKDFPTPEHLYQLVGDGLADDFPALRSATTHRTNLPEQLTSFVGRERESTELHALLEHHRSVTLIGSGGSGKTRLMLHVGAELLGGHADGVWLVELAPITDPGLVVREVARALGTSEEPGRAVLETLIDFLRSKSLLLLVDNCEHLIDAAADLVGRLLVGCPGLTVMASSREALGIPGEAVFQVPSLSLPVVAGPDEHERPSEHRLERAMGSEAVRLFVERAAAALPAFSLTSANADAVVEICGRLDGIPLAIELAAARVPVLSVDDIARGLGDRFRLLTGGRRTAVPRQQTLQALIDWSWDLLDDADRRRLAELSVFAGGCSLDAAVAVTGIAADEGVRRIETIDGLTHLVERSLLVAEHRDPTRYRLLETIRQYARDRLTAAGRAVVVRDRHLGFFFDLVLEAEPALFGPDMIPWLVRLDAEVDNLRAALEWSFEADPERALRLSVALWPYWRSRAIGTEAVERLRLAAETALGLLEAASAPTPQQTVLAARVLAAASNAYAVSGLPAHARGWAERATALARESGDLAALSQALIAQTMVAAFSGRDPGDAFEEANQLARGLGDWWTMTMTEAGGAIGDMARGDLPTAEARVARATDAAARSGNPFAIAFAGLTRGRVSGWAGRLPEARRWLGEAIEAYQRMGDPRFVLVAHSDLAHALRRGGKLDEAEALYRQTIHEWQHAGSRGAIASQIECFAFIATARGEGERAAHLVGAAEAIRELAGTPMMSNEAGELQATMVRLGELMESPALDVALAEGRRLSLDEAVLLALSAGP
jgi:predicted ATPase/class 3 adenylate cyclase